MGSMSIRSHSISNPCSVPLRPNHLAGPVAAGRIPAVGVPDTRTRRQRIGDPLGDDRCSQALIRRTWVQGNLDVRVIDAQSHGLGREPQKPHPDSDDVPRDQAHDAEGADGGRPHRKDGVTELPCGEAEQEAAHAGQRNAGEPHRKYRSGVGDVESRRLGGKPERGLWPGPSQVMTNEMVAGDAEQG